jgi:hypothetical protein
MIKTGGWLAFSAMVLVGCTGVKYEDIPLLVEIETPKIEDFPKAELTYHLIGSQNQARQYIVNYLSKNSHPHTIEIRTPETYVITAWISEPIRPMKRRYRETAYRFAVSQQEGSFACSPVSVAWITKSRGFREEIWTIQGGDKISPPPSWQDVKKIFDNKSCQ